MPEFLNNSVDSYVNQLASGDSIPGGGSAAGLAGALGSALLCMSAQFTVGKPKFADFDAAAQAVLTEAAEIAEEMKKMMEEDSESFSLWGKAFEMPKSTEEEKAARKAAMQDAAKASALAPYKIAQGSYRALQLAGVLAVNCNPMLVSDVAVAAHLVKAAFHSAVINVKINLKSITDETFTAPIWANLKEMEDADALADKALTAAHEIMGF
jgi:formiminotetrahydrofolate cyclodeaminase